MNVISLAISALSNTGYAVFMELTSNVRCRLVAEKDGCYLCIVRTSISDKLNSPVLKIGTFPTNTSLIVCVDKDKGDVWIIPLEDVAELTSIRLGKRWDCYKCNVAVATSLRLDIPDRTEEYLTGRAKEAAARLTTTGGKGVSNEHG